MKTVACTTFLLALGIISLLGCQAKREDAKKDLIKIHYEHAGLEVIDISNNDMIYIYHTLKNNRGPMKQDMSSYDKHMYNAVLSSKETDLVHAWLVSNNALNLKSPTGVKNVPTYGSAFKSSISIQCGKQINIISWSGDSVWASSQENDAIVLAVTSLRDLCCKVLKIHAAS
jgi:hypothetical protein